MIHLIVHPCKFNSAHAIWLGHHAVIVNVVAKAELFDAIGDALGGALDFVGDTAKGVLCMQ
jgi:hypothetical protein